MVRKCVLLGITLLALFLAGCASTTYYEFVAVTNNPVGSKVGEARVAEGGIYQAAKNGGITKIAVVERRVTQGGSNAGVFIVVIGD
ncbi:MAG: TRL-like family protein [Treponema sp.]|jgi:hypothetical protein|nr:TRL-like family protein [Treponema sp.]